MKSKLVICLALLALSALFSGCTTVQPWERAALADPAMRPDRDPLQSALADHIYFSREASTGGRSVGSSGCGCN